MGWRLRKSFTPFPGVRLTLSPKGFSTSLGVGPFRLSNGSQGTALTTRIPGSGISYRKNLSNLKQSAPEPSEPTPTWIQILDEPDSTISNEMQEINSAGSSVLTTPGLIEYKKILSDAHEQRDSILLAIESARSEEEKKRSLFFQRKDSWLYKKIFPGRYSMLRTSYEEASAERQELELQASQSRVQTEIDLPEKVKQCYARMVDVFAEMSRSKKIWDTTSHRDANKSVERTSASRILTRELVRFGLSQCDLIESEWKVPHLENHNGGDLYIYPGFLLYFVSKDAFALLEISEFHLGVTSARFIEESELPSDSVQVGSTWLKVNKDGTPDKRFRDNRQLAILSYGKINISSNTGLNEEFMISNQAAAESFKEAWVMYVDAVIQAK